MFFTLLVGPVTVALIDGIGSFALDRNLFTDESGAIVQRSILIALPFVVLLIFNVRNKACWIAPALATWIFHGFFLWSDLSSLLAGDTSGANIGYGLLSLIFPVVALLVSALARVVYNGEMEPSDTHGGG